MAERYLTVGVAPHISYAMTTEKRMAIGALCLFLPILQSSLSDGFASLIIAAAAISAAVAVEALLSMRKKRNTIADFSAVLTALVFSVLLPNTINPAIAAFCVALSILTTKWSFGGLGANWLSTAAIAWLLVRFCWPEAFTNGISDSPLIKLNEALNSGVNDSSGSPLAILRIIGNKFSDIDLNTTRWLNENLFFKMGAELPTGYIDLFIIQSSSVIADRALASLLIGSLVAIALSLVPFYVPLCYLATYATAVRVWGALPYGGGLFSGDILFGISTGAVMIGAFVLAANPSVSQKTRIGKLITAGIAALLAFFLRYFCGEAYSIVAAALAINVFSPLARTIETSLFFSRRRQL